MHIITALPTKTKTGTPVTLAEGREQCNIEPDETAFDNKITLNIAIAIDKAEADTNSDILETTNVLEFDVERGFQCYTIPHAPFLSFTKLQKLEADGTTWTDVAATAYKTEKAFSTFDIELLESIDTTRLKAIYKTGYAAADIPKVLKGAILIKTADLFDSERQGYTMNVAANRAYESLISKHIRVYY